MSNYKLSWKSDIPCTCPHCNNTNEYTVYLNVDKIICQDCDIEFDVALYASNVELKHS